MLLNDAIDATRNMLGEFGPKIPPATISQHLKAACAEWARLTQITTVYTDITLTGAASYAVDPSRVGPIHAAKHIVDSVPYECTVFGAETFNKGTTGPLPSAPYFNSGGGITRISDDTILAYPGVSQGALRLYHSPVPVSVMRQSTEPEKETAASGTTTSVTATTAPSTGIVANYSTTSTYFRDCVILFKGNTTAALAGVKAKITNYAETSASSFTFTVGITLPGTPASGDKFTILDALEINDQYALETVNYAAGICALGYRDLAKTLAPMLLGRYAQALETAKGKRYSSEPSGTNIVEFPTDETDSFGMMR